MSLASRLLALLARLPPALTSDLGVEKDLPAAMPDGVVLLADRYFPRGVDRPPVVLVRTPYGRRSFGVFGRIFAERGYQAVIQSLRGTFGSGGRFEFRDERDDGRATLDWLSRQDWFGGRVGMYGPSYLGFAQWAVAAGAPDFLRALVVPIATSSRRASLHEGGAFHLDFALTLAHTLAHQEGPTWRMLSHRLRERAQLAPAFAHLPLGEADRVAVGRRVPYFHDWLEHTEADDPYWRAMDHSGEMSAVTAAVHLVGGWYDCYLSRQLADFQALRRAGRRPYLTIGPWAHTDAGVMGAGLREALAWFDAQLRDDRSRLRDRPVRVFVMGAKRWLDLADWPPPSTPTRYQLQPAAALATEPPAESAPDRYVYDPASPTPAVGGAVIGRHAGPRDNRGLEARPDVLVYTSAPLDRDLELIGPVAAELHVRSSLPHTDFFVRLCAVAPAGRSTNLCDGLVRLTPGHPASGEDGTRLVRIELSPTAIRLPRGHRLRVLVTSGAHPRFARNPGTGEPLATATALVPAQQEVFHDPGHPSAGHPAHLEHGGPRVRAPRPGLDLDPAPLRRLERGFRTCQTSPPSGGPPAAADGSAGGEGKRVIVAVVGKGGVGKTTVAALLLRRLLDAGERPVLAIDADPSSCLGSALGVPVERTLAEEREALRDGEGRPASMSQGDWLALKTEELLVEQPGFDLLTMGRPEGPGCYCFANNLIRGTLDRLGRSYRHVLLDCEAGLEHLSRRTSGRPDALVCVASRARMAAETVARALATYRQLHGALPARVDLVLNGFEPDEPWAREMTRLAGGANGTFRHVITVPQDPRVAQKEREGRALLDLDPAAPAVAALAAWRLS